MAYNQKPGSAIKQKTGHGIPSALLQKSKEVYKLLDKTETERGKGPTSAAKTLLKGYAQEKNLTDTNSFKAVEQMQIAQDSTNYISGARNAAEKLKLGKDFNRTYSTNNPKVRARQAAMNNGNTDYQGVGAIGSVTGKGQGSTAAKETMLWNLQKSADQLFGTEDRGINSTFGIPYIGGGNPKTKVNPNAAPKQMKPSSPAKQKQDLGKEPKSSGPEKTAKQIKEEKMPKEPAPKQMKPKGSAAKMKKC